MHEMHCIFGGEYPLMQGRFIIQYWYLFNVEGKALLLSSLLKVDFRALSMSSSLPLFRQTVSAASCTAAIRSSGMSIGLGSELERVEAYLSVGLHPSIGTLDWWFLFDSSRRM